MNTLKQLERLKKAHKLIKQSKTGSPSEFSRRLHISQRGLYRILEYLKEQGAKISFSRFSNTYYYKEDFELSISISIKVLVKEELVIIYSADKLQY